MMTTVTYVDLDHIRYRNLNFWVLNSIRKKINNWNEKRNNKIKYAYIRESANSHVHLMLILERNMDLLDHFILRSIFNDDPYRIAMDLKRIYSYGYIEDKYNRIFDMKRNGNRIKYVGQWEMIYPEFSENLFNFLMISQWEGREDLYGSEW
ncbi:MAG: hypothetical protein QXU79_04660 [Candidatus Micrarchaeaceae archaeon]